MYDKDLYEWYKEHHICVQCGTYTAAPNRIRCEVCLAKNAESTARSRKKSDHKSRSEYMKNLREERKTNGLCIWCGKKATNGVFCMECKSKNQMNNEKRKSGIDRAERPMYGICYRCGKNPVVEGKKLCEACYQSSLRSLEIGKDSEKTLARREYLKKQNNLIFRSKNEQRQLHS